MIPSTDPRTSAIPQGARHTRAVQMPDRPGEAWSPGLDHVEHLSEMLEYLRALQEHCGSDRRLNDRVRDVAVRLQALIHALSTAAGVEPAHGHVAAANGPVPPPSVSELENAFVRWLADPVASDEVQLDEDDPGPRPMRPVLDALCSSARPLPGEVAATVGMPAGTTIGHAVSELRLAVDDPAGPRCRSYRAAAYYLRGLDRIALATTEVERTLP